MTYCQTINNQDFANYLGQMYPAELEIKDTTESFILLTPLRTFMAGAASQAGDADSSRAPGLTSGLQGSVNVHRGTLLLVPQ